MPLLILVALAIKIDSRGPVLFRQTRYGFNGKPFKIFKFRSMSVLEDGATIIQARAGDSRVTRIGALIRKTSIDEIPQLLNVLRGEMSIVGPRPHAAAHDDYYLEQIEDYAFRHHVKPGITGWAQVHGQRGETETLDKMQQRVQYDLWYINNWSLWLDCMIMLRTVSEVVRGENAH
jgi:exopolysaccharide biosynthesis polyprenyl glycosylphosphotransferase